MCDDYVAIFYIMMIYDLLKYKRMVMNGRYYHTYEIKKTNDIFFKTLNYITLDYDKNKSN